MAGKRKQHSAAFKAQVALAALKGDKTVNELASLRLTDLLVPRRPVHRQVLRWPNENAQQRRGLPEQ